MIKEAYCSSGVSKLLREKGFSQDDTRILNTCYKYNGNFCNNVKSMSRVDREISFMAPTHQMAVEWIRQKYNLHIMIDRRPDGYAPCEENPSFKALLQAFAKCLNEGGTQ